jgi:hypothetical protein
MSRRKPCRITREPTTAGHVAVAIAPDGSTLGMCSAAGVRLCNASCVDASVRVTALEAPDLRWPDALVFSRDMSDSDRTEHGWKSDPLAAWHFAKYGTGCMTTLERAEALLKWARSSRPVVFQK